jgi:ribosomal protein S18 acetylase RimI-like enzyme
LSSTLSSAASSVNLRPATRSDATALGRLGGLLVRQHHAMDPARFIPAEPDTDHWYGVYLESQLDQPGVVILVAEEDGEVIGFVYAGLEGTDWMALRGPAGAVYDLVVDPARRRGGVGRALLGAALEALAGLGAPRVVLSTAERNEAAQRLFVGAGFRPTMREMTRELDRSGSGLDGPGTTP